MSLNKKNHHTVARNLLWKSVHSFIIASLVLLIGQSCKKMDSSLTQSSPSSSYDPWKITDTTTLFSQINLVSDTTSYGASIIDSTLVNAWGLAINDENEFWVNAADNGLSEVYDHLGHAISPAVVIPFAGGKGSPTGVLYNETTDFIIPSSGEKSEFIFVTEEGTVAAWASGDTATTVADRSADSAVYKGVEVANNAGANYLYASNFRNATVDVFDASFNYVPSIKFVDPDMPAGFAPFNIKNFDGKLWVTYAKQLGPDNTDDEAGPGNGFVDIYNPDGSLVSRFTSQGALNSPWGMAEVPSGMGYLIGNFGDGVINIYDTTGTWVSTLKGTGGNTLVIEGLWSIVFPQKDEQDRRVLYFTAGPDDEEHGLFGYITPE